MIHNQTSPTTFPLSELFLNFEAFRTGRSWYHRGGFSSATYTLMSTSYAATLGIVINVHESASWSDVRTIGPLQTRQNHKARLLFHKPGFMKGHSREQELVGYLCEPLCKLFFPFRIRSTHVCSHSNDVSSMFSRNTDLP